MKKIRCDRSYIKNQWVSQVFAHLFITVVILTLPWTAQAQTVLSASPFGPPGHLLNTRILSVWAQSVASATNGRVEVRILSAAVAPPADILDAIRIGKADLSLVSNGALKKPLLLNAVVEFAGQTKNAEATSLAYQSLVNRHRALADEFEGVQLLGVFTHGPGVVLLNEAGVKGGKNPIGLTLHAGGSGAEGVVRDLGAIPVVAPGPAAARLLTEGKVQGSVTPLDSFTSFNLTDSVREVLVMPGGFYNAGLGLIANRQKWESLDERDKAAIEKVSGEVLARLAGRAWDTGDTNALQKMRAMGVTVTDIDIDLLKKFNEYSELRRKSWASNVRTLSVNAENTLSDYQDELNKTASLLNGAKITP